MKKWAIIILAAVGVFAAFLAFNKSRKP